MARGGLLSLHTLVGWGCVALAEIPETVAHGWRCRICRNIIAPWVSEDTHKTSLNTKDDILLALNFRKPKQRSTQECDYDTGIYFSLGKLGISLPNWHYRRILAHLPLSLPALQFNELLPTLQCWDNSASLFIFIPLLWLLEEDWIFDFHKNNLILEFLGLKSLVIWFSSV